MSPPGPSSSMAALPAKPLMASPRMTQPPAWMVRPLEGEVSWLPSSQTTGLPAYPLCVVASMLSASVTAGKAVCKVICAVPAILKSMMLAPPAASAWRMACRSEPAPLSAAVVTQ